MFRPDITGRILLDAEPAISQQKIITVTGQLTDKNGEPIPGVNVIIKGTRLNYVNKFQAISLIQIGNNTWTEAKNMGSAINNDELEFAPALSPDQKYLFFTRRETLSLTS